MTDTQTICAAVVTCFTSAMTILGYWLKKRKQVTVTRLKFTKVEVESDKAEVEK